MAYQVMVLATTSLISIEERYRDWDNVSTGMKRELIDKERIKILRYEKWTKLNSSLK